MPWELTADPQGPGEADAEPEDAGAAGALTPGALPEALSFLDFPTSLDLFEAAGAAPASPAERPAQAPEETPRPPEGPFRAMAPLVVKLLPPQQARAVASAAGSGAAMPRLALRAPGALPAYPMARTVHSGSQGGAGRMTPGLQVLLPPETEDGELEVQILVRRNGLIVAKASTPLAGPGTGGSEILSIEFKRS
jgi:hypothetical protein